MHIKYILSFRRPKLNLPKNRASYVLYVKNVGFTGSIVVNWKTGKGTEIK